MVEKKLKDKSSKKKFELSSNNLNKLENHKKTFLTKFKKHKSEFVRFCFVLALLIVIYFALTFIFQFRGSYAEQIMMDINPQYEYLSLAQGEEAEVLIETDINTNLFCGCSCEYVLRDLSQGGILDNGSLSFYNYENFEFSFMLNADKLGSGQELFLFEINCVVEESRFCSESNVPIMRSSLITLNYGPSEEDLLKKEELETLIDEATALFSGARSNILSAETKISNFSSMKTNHLSNELFKLKLFESILEQDLENVNEVWSSQNFSLIQQSISDNKLLEKAIHFNEESDDLIHFIESERRIHNLIIDNLIELNDSMAYLGDLRKSILLSDMSEPSPSLFNLYTKSSQFKSIVEGGDFESYRDLNSSLTDLLNLKNSLNESYIDILNNSSNNLSAVVLTKNLLSADLCMVQNLSGCGDYFTEDEVVENLSGVRELVNYSANFYDDLSNLINLKNDLSLRINSSRENMSSSLLDGVDLQKLKIEYLFVEDYKGVFDEGSYEFELLDDYSSTLQNSSSVNLSNLQVVYNSSEYFLPLSYLDDELNELVEVCSVEDYSLGELVVGFEPYFEINRSVSNVSFIDDVSAICCFDSQCSACCDYEGCRDDLRYPLIAVHGYSFYSYNSAFHSANAFNDFSRKALEDGLYYPAGIIGPGFHPDYRLYDLSRSVIPPLFKATYYEVLNFEEIGKGEYNIKSFSIRDYADNLYELVEFVKNVTGRDKVDLVAHSMGGLVTRSYVDKYGDDSLNKIVLVGTPNKGVPLRLLYLCKFFGG
ncbi:MAG: esterase/lipase family protein, partial [Candidatus Woesearchaeota archaeon]